MSTLFTRILNKELPGHFVYSDDKCGVFLSIAPLKPGHVLVVPKQEIDHWVDIPTDLTAHLMMVAQKISRAQMKAFNPRKIALLIAGLEVPHAHIHLIPILSESELDFSKAKNASQEELASAAQLIRDAIE